LLGSEGVSFDLRNFSWIGKAASNIRVLVLSARSHFQSLAELRGSGERVLFSAAGVGSAAYIEATLITRLLEINSRIVPGYSGNDGQLSMMRGETDATIASLSAIREFTQSGHARMLLVVSGDATALTDIPAARTHVKTPQAGHIFQLMDTVASLGRLTAAPPGVPAGRLAVLRDAYKSTLRDPEFLAQAEAMRLHIAPAFGEAVANALDAVLSDPEDKRAAVLWLLDNKAVAGQ
jgi:tripartite-type tricarboxylate transporter receptor subunit TctC